MLTEHPNVRGTRNGVSRDVRDGVGIGEALGAATGQRQTLVFREADQVDVETKRLQFAKLQAEQFFVPPGIQGQLVVGDRIRAALGRRPSGRDHDRHFRDPELAGA